MPDSHEATPLMVDTVHCAYTGLGVASEAALFEPGPGEVPTLGAPIACDLSRQVTHAGSADCIAAESPTGPSSKSGGR